jgi:uncharacterized protein
MTEILATGLILFGGSCLQGLTGFGYSMLCLPLLALFMPVKDAVPVLIATSVILNLLVWADARRSIRIRWLLPLMIAGLAGIPIGVWSLGIVSEQMLKIAVGILVVLSSVAYLTGFRMNLPKERLAMLPVGLVSGVLNGSTSFSGPPVILFLANQDVSRDTLRGSLSVYFLLLNAATVPAFIAAGEFSPQAGRMTLAGVPLVLAGGLLGTWLSGRVGEKGFRTAALGFLGLLGLLTLVQAVARGY